MKSKSQGFNERYDEIIDRKHSANYTRKNIIFEMF